MYAPKAIIFETMQKFDRPLTLPQLRNSLPNIPSGTISSTLNLFVKEKLATMEKTEEGGKAHAFRLVVSKLPEKFAGSRLDAPVQRGLTRNKSSKKPEAVLLMIPLPKGQSAVVTVEEAKAIYTALTPFFKE